MKSNRETIPEIINNLRRVIQAINEYSKAAERSTCLTGSQLWALKILNATTLIKVSDLACQMHLSPATVVGIIDRLELKGLVSRSRSNKDRRTVELQLTPVGIELAASSPEVAEIMLIKGLGDLPDDQFNSVENGMELMVRILDAQAIAPQHIHS